MKAAGGSTQGGCALEENDGRLPDIKLVKEDWFDENENWLWNYNTNIYGVLESPTHCDINTYHVRYQEPDFIHIRIIHPTAGFEESYAYDAYIGSYHDARDNANSYDWEYLRDRQNFVPYPLYSAEDYPIGYFNLPPIIMSEVPAASNHFEDPTDFSYWLKSAAGFGRAALIDGQGALRNIQGSYMFTGRSLSELLYPKNGTLINVIKETSSAGVSFDGCIDDTAINYHPDAINDGGSCIYVDFDDVSIPYWTNGSDMQIDFVDQLIFSTVQNFPITAVMNYSHYTAGDNINSNYWGNTHLVSHRDSNPDLTGHDVCTSFYQNCVVQYADTTFDFYPNLSTYGTLISCDVKIDTTRNIPKDEQLYSQAHEIFEWYIKNRWVECDGQIISGCTDLSACNYNSEAIQDDGSCWYVDGVCDCNGNIPEGVCNCEGDTSEILCGDVNRDCDCVCFNDVDNDNICDEEDECIEQGGISQECGCNTPIPDGDCDCNGNVDLGCGCNNIEQDICGVCNGPGYLICWNGQEVCDHSSCPPKPLGEEELPVIDPVTPFCPTDFVPYYRDSDGDGLYDPGMIVCAMVCEPHISQGIQELPMWNGYPCIPETEVDPFPNLSEHIFGCTDPLATCNFNPSANIDDGSCEYPLDYCYDTNPQNGYCDIGGGILTLCSIQTSIVSGIILVPTEGQQFDISGCMNPSASNYNSQATIDDGSCILDQGCGFDEYPPIAHCYEDTDGDGLFDPEASCGETCLNQPCPEGCISAAISHPSYTGLGYDADPSTHIGAGCTDSTACNYDSSATVNDGSCLYPGIGNTEYVGSIVVYNLSYENSCSQCDPTDFMPYLGTNKIWRDNDEEPWSAQECCQIHYGSGDSYITEVSDVCSYGTQYINGFSCELSSPTVGVQCPSGVYACTEEQCPGPIAGDINQDYQLNQADLNQLNSFILSLAAAGVFTNMIPITQLYDLDVNNDGNIDVNDLDRITELIDIILDDEVNVPSDMTADAWIYFLTHELSTLCEENFGGMGDWYDYYLQFDFDGDNCIGSNDFATLFLLEQIFDIFIETEYMGTYGFINLESLAMVDVDGDGFITVQDLVQLGITING